MASRPASMSATVSVREMAARAWDAVVLGAGPAGSMAALRLAKDGLRVLLVERTVFPRPKVCGCCVSGAALDAVALAGVADVPERLNAPMLRELRVHYGRASARVPLDRTAVISREALDALLVREAVRAGADFVDGVSASVPPGGTDVSLRAGPESVVLRARAVIAADGVAGRVLGPEHGFAVRVSARSRIGCGTILPHGPSDYEHGRVYMACGPTGYVGLVRFEDSRLNVAAALAPDSVRARGGPGPAASAVLQSCGLPPIDGLSDVTWRGTARLTRRRVHLQRASLFAVGDSAAYVEPFTGEGIAWALSSGWNVGPHVAAAIRAGAVAEHDTWTEASRRLFALRHRECGLVAEVLRRPRIARTVVRAVALAPAAGRLLVRAVDRRRPAPRRRAASELTA